MIFAPPFHRVVEHVDRRALGAVQFVDAVTGLPVTGSVKMEIQRVALAGAPLSGRSVQIRQNRSGLHVILHAPFFDEYSASFDDPQTPPETSTGTRLRLRLAVTDAGPHYLPQEFDFDLPRSLVRTDAENVFQPRVLKLFRSPGAPVVGGWSVLRVHVIQEGTRRPLPGVLVRVFRKRLRYLAFVSDWSHSFNRLFTVTRAVLWRKLDLRALLERHRTAGGSFRMLGMPQEAYLPEF